ncbi:hypothetical protein DPMN_053242 [Dreissena polymorpha]|uniref:Uncharacterized protein n=1 Tax=Dreissena polymorpha TaxID=45954 RepID=A0A9D4CMN6_DREPO|nr:hypothetical protein DPMN_053242 [Dreissena polymorpha]
MHVSQVGHFGEAHFARVGVNAHYKVRLAVHHAQHVIEKPVWITGALEHRATVVALENAWKQTRACQPTSGSDVTLLGDRPSHGLHENQ